MISFSYQKIPQHHPHHHKRLIHGGCWKGKELKHKQQNRLLDKNKKHNKRNEISVYRPSWNNIKRWGLSAERREKSSLKIKTAKLTNHSPTKTEVGHKTKNNNIHWKVPAPNWSCIDQVRKQRKADHKTSYHMSYLSPSCKYMCV